MTSFDFIFAAFRAVVLTLLLAEASANADTHPTAVDDVDTALATAAKTGKPLLVEFTAVWCEPCRVMQRTLSDTKVKSSLKDWVFVAYDVDTSVGGEMAERFGIKQFPTLIAFANDGHEVSRSEGALEGAAGIEKLRTFLQDAVELSEDEKELRVALSQHPKDPMLLRRAAVWHETRGRWSDAARYWTALAKQRAVAQNVRDEASVRRNRAARIARWRQELIESIVTKIRITPGDVSPDELALVIVDSSVPLRQRAKLVTRMFESLKIDDRGRYIQVALAGAAVEEGLSAAKAAVRVEHNSTTIKVLAEAHYANGEIDQALNAMDDAIALAGSATEVNHLKDERSHFESSKDDSELQNIRRQVALAWLKLEQLETLPTIEPTSRSGRVSDALSIQAVGSELGTACVKYAAGRTRAYVRLSIDVTTSHIVEQAVFLPDDGLGDLRACLIREIPAALARHSISISPFTVSVTF